MTAHLLLACAAAPTPETEVPPLVAVTFNTGTSEGMAVESDEDGYGEQQAAWSDQHYGDGLAWSAAIASTRGFFDAVQPALVAFQEIFWTGDCAAVPEEARAGFVCEGWVEGDSTVAQLVLGEGYQVACHPGKPDKCLAVRTAVGRFAGCEEDLCLEGLAGSSVDGCGTGARVARGFIEELDLTVVSVHGSSGFEPADQACRVAQVDQVFLDLGDGEPGANGAQNLVLGDLNTDPYRFASFDPSAQRWAEFVGEGLPFAWISEVGPEAPGSYGGVADIDHLASDARSGDCWYGGLDGRPSAYEGVLFDHRPVVCGVALPSPK